ncbi:zinc-dependent alcohol dehydrogenase [Anaeromyxobacter diazotrophicus]|uniref:Glutathione-dependent formaldehyde dehydrogenase n=1 Tax=Anaeromyxobacter diazotrophicus TaxID=2590199 RepID=A0A7I9VHY5_9BACT|nr:zinc-dependent alcohol dehydrogenase [Anaeromyxobacter diazotrophicus]GEJ56016.1 glutathione-dependent formaldehyde dehydrogenase [Anaeromyxobacter diazotrophicus]
MRATSYEGPYRIAVKDKPDPRIEHPQDAILRVTCAGICGSDLHLLHGRVPDTRIGSTFGHEIVGVVEEVGPEVTAVSRGDRLVVPFNISCGACYFCSRGLTACCENTNPSSDVACGVYGYSHTTGGYDGGQAEYVRVPFADVDPMKLPDGLSDLQAVPLADAYPTGYQGAEMCGLEGGETVVVFGAGPVGLYAMRSAWLLGAGRVIAVDKVGYRLDFARRWAGAEAIDFEDADVITAIKDLTDGRGADATIEAVGCEAAGSPMQRAIGVYVKGVAGSATALNWCFHATKKGGTVSVLGVFGPPMALVDFGTAMNKCQTIRTGQCSVKRYLPQLLEHVQAGRMPVEELITHRYPLEEASRAYHTFAQKEDGCVKAVLLPGTGTVH